MRIILGDERVLEGTALQIVRAMQDVAFSPADFTTAEYIHWVVENARRGQDVELEIVGETDDERAQSLVAEMLRVGLARKA